MSARVLCVDDDLNVLAGFRRQLYKQFELVTASSGEEGLQIVTVQEPFAVIMSDMRMPGMDGIEFFAEVCKVATDSVRIMLTGAADQRTAIDAINRGNIFRFLTKPCSTELLVHVLQAGVEQYRLITAERTLLENTLKGSIKVLVDILALTNPVAFSRANRLRHYVTQIVRILQLPDQWQFEVAAMLSLIGCVTIPVEILEKVIVGGTLQQKEKEMVENHPRVGGQLITNIPRLETIARMISDQLAPLESPIDLYTLTAEQLAIVGAQILKVASEFDVLLSRGDVPEKAIASLSHKFTRYNPEIIAALNQIDIPSIDKVKRGIKISELKSGMVLAEDIRTDNGVLLVCKDHEVNETMRLRLLNFAIQESIPESVLVFTSSLKAEKPVAPELTEA